MSKPKILIQIDPDAHASVFDAVVAVDSGVDHLLQYHGVEPTQVRDLVHGAIFTRGPADLKQTAIFIGGQNVDAGEDLLRCVTDSFFGPMRVSVLLDANGANTTAAAAVIAAARHLDLRGSKTLVLAATGPVGKRAARLLARQGAHVRVGSRSADRSKTLRNQLLEQVPDAEIEAVQTATGHEVTAALDGVQLVIAAGAAGFELLDGPTRVAAESLQVAIDLNAVPPLGIAGVEVMDKGQERDGMICYGAIGVGGTKMKLHKAAVQKLFESNDQVIDAEEAFAIGQTLE
ncbi:MAG TPA: bifunctional NADP-dependent methylenetetrahydromethanopterin dehydrogenase/methylenetetrahydrofolate dehydrogenase [Planctomycetaceae bacterium]|nr:bifunctional NADP-dependent methylenetetrahydromethanopterin dehydrogenase/methylenetetrahydrofolate dehydrogenase [Blastopirellula sp.]HAY80929.1 bifunctional NADP-dependent methylenetetrahydromethanopterin dehydrogenase/methylenetetrahydrofolate dehydrogenase [Planctomycetaceae bacterium]|tara:strand:+ start:195 stop:1061 length:867 start_codon:yes stop_codon:yes gene_type:complete